LEGKSVWRIPNDCLDKVKQLFDSLVCHIKNVTYQKTVLYQHRFSGTNSLLTVAGLALIMMPTVFSQGQFGAVVVHPDGRCENKTPQNNPPHDWNNKTRTRSQDVSTKAGKRLLMDFLHWKKTGFSPWKKVESIDHYRSRLIYAQVTTATCCSQA
jgi:hypothetical protein